MSQQEWTKVLQIIEKAVEEGSQQTLFSIMLTADEREALVTRVKILDMLLNQNCAQRQISQELGVGIATVTRGNNELKNCSDEELAVLAKLLEL